MHSASTNQAPWQIGQVTPAGRIAAAALAALVIDSVFLWQAAPHFVVAFGLTAIPLVVGIRVIRGFPRSVDLAAGTFGVIQVAVGGLALASNLSQVTAALFVAVALSATGLAAIGASWLKRRRAAVIEIEVPVRVMARARVPRRYR